jgi:hypothetical protein
MQSAYTQFRNMTVMVKAKRRQLVKGSAAFTLLLALALLGGSATASAQDDSKNQDAVQSNSAETPEGSWLYKVTIPDPPGDPIVFVGTETYAAGGGYVEADQLSFTPGYLATAGHGAWRITGKNRFVLTYLNLTYDASGNPTGSGKVRQAMTLDGTRYSGSGDFFYYDLNGNVIASGTFTITAKKIRVEAPKE